MNKKFLKARSMKIARKLRIAVVKNVFKQGLLTEEQAKDLLSGNLDATDDLTFCDDSELLTDDNAISKIESD